MSFEHLTPETIIPAVEAVSGLRLTGLLLSLPSYINRVYELQAADGTRLIAKFYRPGRWSREAIVDEHRFVNDCRESEIPVVPPLVLRNESTIGEFGGFLLALFPKRAGRQIELNTDADWQRIGSLVARCHLAGERQSAQHRITIGPGESALSDVKFLCEKVLPAQSRERYRSVAMQIIESSMPLFEGLERIRIHGDCHRGNILDRMEEGLLLIDFDDMAMGPPVQDIWLLLPDRATSSKSEIEHIISGYERFRRFDRAGLRCIESLRAMRMIYFLAWCSRQSDDARFRKTFPEWGSDTFWQKETNDLREQLGFVLDEGSE